MKPAPRPPDPRIAQAASLVRAGRGHEAQQLLHALLREDGHNVDARVAMARALTESGDNWTAAAWLSDACRARPDIPELWLELIRLLAAERRSGEAANALVLATKMLPDDLRLARGMADLRMERGEFALAEPLYARLYAQQPNEPAFALHHGYCLEHLGQVPASVERYRAALALAPDLLEAHVDLAGVLWRVADYDGALVHAQRAVALAPNHPYAVRILGTALMHLNRLDEAEFHLRRSLQLKPGFTLAQIDLALALLLGGKMEEGWAMFRHRWDDRERMPRPAFFRAELEWQGPAAEPPAGKRFLVYAEQGLGDTIQFARFLPLLVRQAASVHVAVQAELTPLVEAIPGVRCPRPNERIEFDHHVAMLDLPLHLAPRQQDIPREVPYLHAPSAKASEWRERLQPWEGKLRVGIAWVGQPRHVNQLNRSMPLATFAPLLALDGVQCFSLQKGSDASFTDLQPAEGALVDLTAHWRDFGDSAAMVSHLDLVISIDSAVAHLAGALAIPVWLLLPPNSDWRWLLEREDSPWYPTMRIFRRARGEERSAQMERVVAALKGEQAKLLAQRQGALL